MRAEIGAGGLPVARRENDTVVRDKLTARIQPFDSLWHGSEDIEKDFRTFPPYYRHNYLRHLPLARDTKTLIVGCGPGYFAQMLKEAGFTDVLGIDSYPEKVEYANARGLNCRVDSGFGHLDAHKNAYDMIICEQDLCHLTKDEMVDLLRACHESLRPGGALCFYVLNGGNPLTGCSSLAETFDHFALYTESSLRSLLTWCGFEQIHVFPLNPYVFWTNPLNYVGMAAAAGNGATAAVPSDASRVPRCAVSCNSVTAGKPVATAAMRPVVTADMPCAVTHMCTTTMTGPVPTSVSMMMLREANEWKKERHREERNSTT